MLGRGSHASVAPTHAEPLLMHEGRGSSDRREGIGNSEKRLSVKSSRVSFAAHSVVPTAVRKQYRPYVMGVVIFVNVAVFVWEMSVNKWQFAPSSVNPMYGPAPSTLVKCGAKDAHRIVALGEFWRLFTTMFIHGGILHLLMNMLGVFRLGCDYERQYGSLRVGLVYFAAGVFSTIISTIFSPSTITVGASGAIFGLIGACWADFIQNFGLIAQRVSFVAGLTVSTLLSLCLGLLPWLDNFAHLGGFYFGFITALCVFVLPRLRPDGSSKPRLPYQTCLMVVAALLSILSVVLAYYFMLQAYDINRSCPWCQYLSCVPTPWWPCAPVTGACELVSSLGNGTIVVRCPDGELFTSQGVFSEALCRQLCDL